MPVVISPQCETKSSSSSTWLIKDPGLQISQAFQPVRTSKLLHRAKTPQSGHNHFLMSKSIATWIKPSKLVMMYIQQWEVTAVVRWGRLQPSECWIRLGSLCIPSVNTVPHGGDSTWMLDQTWIIVYSTSQHSTTWWWWWHYLNAESDSDHCAFHQSTQYHMVVTLFECWIRLGSLCIPPVNRIPQIGEIILILNQTWITVHSTSQQSTTDRWDHFNTESDLDHCALHQSTEYHRLVRSF